MLWTCRLNLQLADIHITLSGFDAAQVWKCGENVGQEVVHAATHAWCVAPHCHSHLLMPHNHTLPPHQACIEAGILAATEARLLEQQV